MLGQSIELCSQIEGQDISFKDRLSEEELLAFEEELTFKYRLFYESILNVIDNDNNIFSRRNAVHLINNLFQDESASVTDFLDNRYPETMSIKEYGKRLFYLENNLPLLDKRYKFSDSINIQPSFMDINSKKYGHLSNDEAKKKMYQLYKGEVFFLEEMISVQKVRKDVFDAVDRSLVKRLQFEIKHDQHDKYGIFITSISILDPRNRNFDYRKIKEEVRNSSQPWSDADDPEYLKAIVDEALSRGVILVGEYKAQENEDLDDKQSWYYDSPTIWDYVIPGYGHLRFGSDRQRRTSALGYGTAVIGAGALAVHFNIKSNDLWNEALLTSDELSKGALIEQSNNNKKYYFAALGVAVGSYLSHMIHLKMKDNKQKNLIQKVLSKAEIRLEINNAVDRQALIGFHVGF